MSERVNVNENLKLLHRTISETSDKYFKYNEEDLTIDFVLAAHTKTSEENENKRIRYINNLKEKRLIISAPVFSQDEEATFWHVHAPFNVLCNVAEDLNLRLSTKKNDIVIQTWYTVLVLKIGKYWDYIDPFKVKNSYFKTPELYFSDTFEKQRLNEFHNDINERELLFTQAQRSRLVSYVLQYTYYDKEQELGKEELLKNDVFKAMYSCHDGPLLNDYKTQPAKNIRQKLSKEWASFRQIFKYQPIDAIKDYFGIKIAFYFDWVGFYAYCLTPATVIGLLCFCYGVLSSNSYEPIQEICYPKNASLYYMCPLCDKLCSYFLLKDFSCLQANVTHTFDNDLTGLFAVFMSIWSIVYLKLWKRRELTLAYKWHTMNLCEEEVLRPQYRMTATKVTTNPVTGKREPAMSSKVHCLKITGAGSVVLFFVVLVIAALIGVIVYRAAIFGVVLSCGGSVRSNSKLFVTATAAIINLIVINILKSIYKKIAVVMTDWEIPRTRSDYENSFTLKMFWFQFVNTYGSVFYVAFFKSEMFVGWPGRYKRFGDHYRLEGCSAQGCFLELSIQLVVLMGGQQLIGLVIQRFWAYLQKRYKIWKHQLTKHSNVPIWEADYQLADQDELFLYWEYQEIVLQHGFVTMFVAAFPLAPLIALMTTLIEIRIDAINMIKSFRRPVAYQTEGVGCWYNLMKTVTAFSVVINAFVLSLTSEFIPRLIYKYQFSVDGSLKGYVNWSLSSFNVSDFIDKERPETPLQHVGKQERFCRFPGYHEAQFPYDYNKIHWQIMTIKLLFVFFFQWTVSGIIRLISWIIPDRPVSIDLKIKRQNYITKEALKEHKIKTGKRKLDHVTEGAKDTYQEEGVITEKSSDCKNSKSKDVYHNQYCNPSLPQSVL